VQVRRPFANGRVKQTKTRLSRRAVPLQTNRARGARPATAPGRQPAAVSEHTRRPPRLPQLQPTPLEARPEKRRDRAAARPLPPAPHLRHLRASRGRAGVRALAVHGHQHRDDRSPLRPPRSRQPRARGLTSRRASPRAGRGRWVDTGPRARKAAPRHGYRASRKTFPAGRGRSVDVGIRNGYDQTQQKSLISSDFSKPSDGLEPSTPSL
jgi:hypothetical protein